MKERRRLEPRRKSPASLCASCEAGRHINCNGKIRMRIRYTGSKEKDWFEEPCRCPCAPRTT